MSETQTPSSAPTAGTANAAHPGSIGNELSCSTTTALAQAVVPDEFDETVICPEGSRPRPQTTVHVSVRANRREPSTLIGPEFETECEADYEICRIIFWSPDLQRRILSAMSANRGE